MQLCEEAGGLEAVPSSRSKRCGLRRRRNRPNQSRSTVKDVKWDRAREDSANVCLLWLVPVANWAGVRSRFCLQNIKSFRDSTYLGAIQ